MLIKCDKIHLIMGEIKPINQKANLLENQKEMALFKGFSGVLRFA